VAARSSLTGSFVFLVSSLILKKPKMKKRLLVLVLVSAVILPSIAFAARWDPFSWFNNRSFSNKKDAQIQVLENRAIKNSGNTTAKSSIPKPVQKSASGNSQQEVQEWITILNSAINDYQKNVTILQANSDYASQLIKQFVVPQMDEDAASLILAASLSVKVSNQELLKQSDAKINELTLAVAKIKTTNYVDGNIWNYSKLQSLVNFSIYIANEEAAVVKKYKADLTMVSQYLGLLNSAGGTSGPSSDSQLQNPAMIQFQAASAEYNRKLTKIKQQLVEEYKAAGGFWTASQLEYNAMQKLKEMGIKSPVSPYGGLSSYPGSNYDSAHCISNPSGGITCTDTSGSNAGQQTIVNPIPGGGYDIRSY